MPELEDHNRTSIDQLWVLTKIKDSVCAFNSASVEAIMLLEQEVTPLPDSDEIHMGVIRYRGGFLPILDLRRKMGMPSQREEQLEFEEMLEHRKQDHIHWVDELKRCLAEQEKFKLATDPHLCAFGKWYDSYKPSSHTVAYHLRKIDEPHRKLHETALEAFACQRKHDECVRSECLQSVVRRGTEEYMPQVLGLLDEAKTVFRDGYRSMVIAISDGDRSCGIMVDEVLAVETLKMVGENEQLDGNTNPMVSWIAQREDSDGLVLVMNQDRVLEKELLYV